MLGLVGLLTTLSESYGGDVPTKETYIPHGEDIDTERTYKGGGHSPKEDIYTRRRHRHRVHGRDIHTLRTGTYTVHKGDIHTWR